MRHTLKTIIALALCPILVLSLCGCGYKMVYVLDQPVSDPIMYADDSQDSDISKVEEGGYSGSAGECPT